MDEIKTSNMEDNGNKEDDWIRNGETTQYMKESREQINEKGISLSKETKEVTGCKENIIEDKKPKGKTVESMKEIEEDCRVRTFSDVVSEEKLEDWVDWVADVESYEAENEAIKNRIGADKEQREATETGRMEDTEPEKSQKYMNGIQLQTHSSIHGINKTRRIREKK